MEKAAMWILFVQAVLGFFLSVWSDFNGRKARKPLGYGGFVVTVIVFGFLLWLYQGAGFLPF